MPNHQAAEQTRNLNQEYNGLGRGQESGGVGNLKGKNLKYDPF